MTIGDIKPNDIACFPNPARAQLRATGETVPLSELPGAKQA
jgi:hypothetical protein